MLFDPPEDSPLATSVPCIVEISIGGGSELRHYGPFASLNEARTWCAQQVHSNFTVIPLRRIDIERDYNDWYGPQINISDGDITKLIDDLCGLEKFKEWEQS
jgi:hypothetical protein